MGAVTPLKEKEITGTGKIKFCGGQIFLFCFFTQQRNRNYRVHPWGRPLCFWALSKRCRRCGLSAGGWWLADGALLTNSTPGWGAPSHACKKKKKKFTVMIWKNVFFFFFGHFGILCLPIYHSTLQVLVVYQPGSFHVGSMFKIIQPHKQSLFRYIIHNYTGLERHIKISNISLTLDEFHISSQLPNSSQRSWTHPGASEHGRRVTPGSRGVGGGSPLRSGSPWRRLGAGLYLSVQKKEKKTKQETYSMSEINATKNNLMGETGIKHLMWQHFHHYGVIQIKIMKTWGHRGLWCSLTICILILACFPPIWNTL